MTLKDAQVGSTVKVVKIHGEGAYKRRIMDMGITKGSEIFIRKVAPPPESSTKQRSWHAPWYHRLTELPRLSSLRQF